MPAKTWRINLKQKAEIHIGEPIDASQYSLEQRNELITLTHDKIRKLTGEANT
jgi:1-acyl-sn-glycerol-3-phosphate acyltransferase